MPLYEYECKQCGKRFEKIQPIAAAPLTECIECGQGPIRRIIHPVGVIFKGSGWYINDSRKTGATSSPKEEAGSDKPVATPEKPDSSGSKPEAKTESAVTPVSDQA